MPQNLLTEQDTFIGSIAYRNKFISQEQLGEAVMEIQKSPGMRLGDAWYRRGL